MNDQSLVLARAAIDPSAAIAVGEVEPIAVEDANPQLGLPRRELGLTFSVEVDEPPKYSRWRFFVFYLLVRLAARVYPFKFEIYRTPRSYER